MQTSIRPTVARAGSLAAPRLAGPQRQQAAAASQPRVATQKQAVSGGQGIAQRRARAAAAGRRLAAATVAKAGGDVLVVGSSGQTAARVVINLLRTGFKVTAGAERRSRRRGWDRAVCFACLPVLCAPLGRAQMPQWPGLLCFCAAAGVDTDLEESQEVVKFAKQLEILNKGEAASLKVGGRWCEVVRRPTGVGACVCLKRSACEREQQACCRDGLAHWPETGVKLLLHRSPLSQLAEFNPLDADSIAGVLKRGSRVVLVVGDQVRWGYGIVRAEPVVVAAAVWLPVALHLSRSATSPAGCRHIQVGQVTRVTAAQCPAPCRPAGRQPPPRPAHLRCGAGGAAGERGSHLSAGGEWRRSISRSSSRGSSRSSGSVVKATASCGCCALHQSVTPAPITLLGA